MIRPSLATLRRAFGVEKARELAKILRTHTSSTVLTRDLILKGLNEATECHGVEAIRGEWRNNYWGDVRALYVNTGDTYATTFVYDCEAARFLVTSYGDFVESLERNGETLP